MQQQQNHPKLISIINIGRCISLFSYEEKKLSYHADHPLRPRPNCLYSTLAKKIIKIIVNSWHAVFSKKNLHLERLRAPPPVHQVRLGPLHQQLGPVGGTQAQPGAAFIKSHS